MPLNAYLLNHPNDLNLITKYNQDKNVIYARNYFTFFMCKNKKIKRTPHKKLLNKKEVDSLKYFRANWFRDKKRFNFYPVFFSCDDIIRTNRKCFNVFPVQLRIVKMIWKNLFPHNDATHFFDCFTKPISISNGGNNKYFSLFYIFRSFR